MHTWDNPYPELKFEGEESNSQINYIKENITCYLTKENPIDNKDCCIGCPVLLEKDERGRI